MNVVALSRHTMSHLWIVTLSVVGTALLLAFARWKLFLGPVRSPEALPLSPIIDIHCHTAGVGAENSGAFLHPSMRSSWKFGFYLRGFGLTDQDLEEQGDALCVERIAQQIDNSRLVDGAVVLALDAAHRPSGEPDWEQTVLYIPNRFLAPVVERFPQLLFGASVHPYRRDAEEELVWCKRNGAVLIKWLPAIQMMDPADKSLKDFYVKLKELDLPLLCHVGDESSFNRARNELSDPNRLRLPLELGVRVIAAHIGAAGHRNGRENFDATVDLMREFPHLWADISALSLINRKHMLRRALKEPDLFCRLLYGTDYPLTNMPVVSPYYFPLTLRWSQMRRIASRSNSWDRDVLLKQALGVPRQVFANTADFLGLSNTGEPARSSPGNDSREKETP